MSAKPYHVCPECGASLDSTSEICDCQKAEKPGEAVSPEDELQRKSDLLQEQIIAGIRKDAEIRRLSAELEEAHVELRKNWTVTAYAEWEKWHRENMLEKQCLREQLEEAARMVEAAKAEVDKIKNYLSRRGFAWIYDLDFPT